MAARAICPRCRRTFDASALVCTVDGEPLVDADEHGVTPLTVPPTVRRPSHPPSLPTSELGLDGATHVTHRGRRPPPGRAEASGPANGPRNDLRNDPRNDLGD